MAVADRTQTFLAGPASTPGTLPRRRFGKTEERVPILGLGTGPAGFGLSDDDAVDLLHACIDRGVTYIDTAPGYDRAHVQLGRVLPSRRDEVFLATKCFAATAREALEIHESSLRDLRTNCVDLLYAHCVGSFDPDALLGPEGVFAGLLEAKRRGWTRYIGFTAHHSTWKAARLLAAEVPVDAVMLAMNFVDRHTYDFEGQVLPLAGRLDLGIACMKVYGGTRAMNYTVNRESELAAGWHRRALRYALGLPGVAVAVVGMYHRDELEENIAWTREWRPLDPSEERELLEEGCGIAGAWGPHFGDVA
jgi:hypothetical protein